LRWPITMIDSETWLGMDIDVKGEIYEGLLLPTCWPGRSWKTCKPSWSSSPVFIRRWKGKQNSKRETGGRV
jgi:hypothetical protein